MGYEDDVLDDASVRTRVGHDPAGSDLIAAGFELRLDERDDTGSCREERRQDRQDVTERNERHVDRHDVEPAGVRR